MSQGDGTTNGTNRLDRIEATLDRVALIVEANAKAIAANEKAIEEDRKERKAEWRKWNKKWGEIANRIGRVVEDIVAPNIERIAREDLGYQEDPDYVQIRMKVKHPSKQGYNREFDALVIYPDAVIFNETKESARQQDVEKFVAFIESGEFFDYLPQYQGRKLIPILSSLYLDRALVNYLTKHKIYALAMGDETMELLNFERLKGDYLDDQKITHRP